MNFKFFAIVLCFVVFGVVTGHGSDRYHGGGGDHGHHEHGGHYNYGYAGPDHNRYGGHDHHRTGGHDHHSYGEQRGTYGQNRYGGHHEHHGRGGCWGSGGRHSNPSRQHHHNSFVNFEVHDPKGLLVSKIQPFPNTTFFGIELYVNRVPNNGKQQQCDVCLNTTEVTNGKFIVEDGEVIIKRGDMLYYQVLLGVNGKVTRQPQQSLQVTDSIINRCNCEQKPVLPNIDVRVVEPNPIPDRRPTFAVKPSLPETTTTEKTTLPPTFEAETVQNELFPNTDSPFECDLDPVTNLCRTSKTVEPEKPTSTDYENEIQILQGIIDQMKTNCGSERVTNMLLLKTSSPEMVTDNGQAMELVKSSLAISAEMKDLARAIQQVMSTSGAYMFEMPTYLDKQKILYHARMNNLNDVVDYDVVN